MTKCTFQFGFFQRSTIVPAAHVCMDSVNTPTLGTPVDVTEVTKETDVKRVFSIDVSRCLSIYCFVLFVCFILFLQYTHSLIAPPHTKKHKKQKQNMIIIIIITALIYYYYYYYYYYCCCCCCCYYYYYYYYYYYCCCCCCCCCHFFKNYYSIYSAIDYCASNPCVNGDCDSNTSGYTCKCHQGYQGNRCQSGDIC